MKPSFLLLLAAAVLPVTASAFCGFYVARADSKLYNQSSQVALVRDGQFTSITMASDYQGDPKEFALVIPVPTVIDKEDVKVVEKSVLDHLDAYTAPRLVEYWDRDPDEPIIMFNPMAPGASGGLRAKRTFSDGARARGVTIEKQFTAGEYDILVLSAKQSDGLVLWLNENSYKMPEGAEPVLDSYIRQNMKFFVAKVNMERQAQEGRTWLRPIRVSFKSRKFMLPVRLGTVNAKGPQDMIVYVLNRNGRVESTNYRTIQMHTNKNVPEFIKSEFADFYRAMFDLVVTQEKMSSVITEYYWDMGWCDPCSSDPVPLKELRELGCTWLKGDDNARPEQGSAFITRLHVRYDSEHFPEDIVFQETGDTQFIQGRYIINHPWRGNSKTEAAKAYFKGLPKRFEDEATTTASLTGWPMERVRAKQASYKDTSKEPKEQ
ncbi:DUF2330 domain-containing protein [Prosthecobacter sp.]|uniref:DUF2330 domain-containing protein n=1 Tax=Prosthecobacter sp. TaxID=1965333 RepID=UPI002489944E|nr:DUF2330 domain-containing protein [Prosthecobacter sp.]MDI1314723.1 DUF2330 domain-containing protein [Prosthecobacter sp.]